MHEKIKSFPVLDKLGVKNLFVGIPYDFSVNNDKRIELSASLLNMDIKNIYEADQTHSSNIAVVLKNDDFHDVKFQNTDGLITNVPNTGLLIKVADCQGIFLYDKDKKVIGNIHSGWKGTTNKIVLEALDIMSNVYGCNKRDVLVCINPSIKQCHFEIEDNVLNEFKEKIGFMINDFLTIGKVKDGKQKYYLDLPGLNKRLLINSGVREENIYIADECTFCKEEEYYSYRRDRTAKRNGCLISL